MAPGGLGGQAAAAPVPEHIPSPQRPSIESGCAWTSPTCNQELLPRSPPQERTVIEGNIVEHPIWVLTNRAAKPMRKMVDPETGKVLLDPATGKPLKYPDPADYVLEIDLGTDPKDPRKHRALTIRASVHHGFPTVVAFRVLVVVIEKAQALGYSSQKVEITPTEIADGLGMKSDGGSSYRTIYDALNALEGVSLCYVDTYYDITSKSVRPGRHTERLVKKTKFAAARDKEPAPESLPLPGLSASPAAAAPRPGDTAPEPAGEPDNYVELGNGLWASLVGGYRIRLDREYLNDLPNELAQRFYSYLTKKDHTSAEYRENVVNLGRRLGLSKTNPSDICDSLKPAIAAMKTPLGPTGKAFIKAARFVGKRGAMQLVVLANREKDVVAEEQETARRAARLEELKQQLRSRRR